MTDVVLVHGAWHGAWCWDGVVTALHGAGRTAVAVELPFTGAARDQAAARDAIERAGPGVVVVGHSYGGHVISAAAAGLDVARLVYVAAFMTDPDDDVNALMAGSLLPAALVITDTTMAVDPAQVPELFFGDSDPSAAAALAARLRPMALGGAPDEPAGPPAWRSVPSTYVVCTNDRALPVESQRHMAARADEIVEMATDHSPFTTRPDELATLIASHVPTGIHMRSSEENGR